MRRSLGQVTLSYSLKYLRYLGIPLSIDEFTRTLQNLTIMHNTFQHWFCIDKMYYTKVSW